MASKPKTWSGSPKESHGGCRCRWERADLQVRDAGLAKRSLTQRLSMAFCRFLPSLGNHPDILENGAGENWNLSQSLRFGIWSLGCPRYPGGICHGHRAITQLFFFRKWSCLKIQDLRISCFYNQFPNENEKLPAFLGQTQTTPATCRLSGELGWRRNKSLNLVRRGMIAWIFDSWCTWYEFLGNKSIALSLSLYVILIQYYFRLY